MQLGSNQDLMECMAEATEGGFRGKDPPRTRSRLEAFS